MTSTMFTSVARWRAALEHRAAFRAETARITRELDSYRADELAELGLSRSDIPRIARETAGARLGTEA